MRHTYSWKWSAAALAVASCLIAGGNLVGQVPSSDAGGAQPAASGEQAPGEAQPDAASDPFAAQPEQEQAEQAPQDQPAQPEDQPAQPQDQPAQPEDQPAQPQDQPAQPDQPSQEEAQPNQPEANQPETPSQDQPATPADQPQQPATPPAEAQPEQPQQQPSAQQQQQQQQAGEQQSSEAQAQQQTETADQSPQLQGDAREVLGVQFDTSAEQSLTIQEIEQGSLAAQSQLQQGDRIIAIGGTQIRDAAELNRYLTSYSGRTVPIIIERNGQRQTVQLQVPQREQYRSDQIARDGENRPGLGVTFDGQQQGVWVLRVYPQSPADEAGLREGDQVVSVNGQQVNDPWQTALMIHEMNPGDQVTLTVARQGQSEQLSAQLATWQEAFAAASPDQQPLPPDQLQYALQQRQQYGLSGGMAMQQGIYQGDMGQGMQGRMSQRGMGQRSMSEFGPPPPPQYGQGQIAGTPDRQTVMRPNIEAMSRIEQLEQQVNSLQQEVQQLRATIQQLQSQQGAGGSNAAQPQQQNQPPAAPAPPAPPAEANQGQPGSI